ncbi:hypothetical protein Egran_03159, partial [Elaphomyces granulatus]
MIINVSGFNLEHLNSLDLLLEKMVALGSLSLWTIWSVWIISSIGNMSNHWHMNARHYPIEDRSSYHIDEQGGRRQGDEMISRATPRSYPHQRDPPHPGSTPQETGREPFGWQNSRPNIEYLAAQPPSLGPIEYTQEMGDP